jgi:hypothetical protein
MEKLMAELRMLTVKIDPKPMPDRVIREFLTNVMGVFFTEEAICSFSGEEVRRLMVWFFETGEREGYDVVMDTFMGNFHLITTTQRTLSAQPKIQADNVVSLFSR